MIYSTLSSMIVIDTIIITTLQITLFKANGIQSHTHTHTSTHISHTILLPPLETIASSATTEHYQRDLSSHMIQLFTIIVNLQSVSCTVHRPIRTDMSLEQMESLHKYRHCCVKL